MSGISSHVLDTARGVPAEGMQIDLYRIEGDNWAKLRTVVTNSDGRVDGALLGSAEMAAGHYELVFHFGKYLRDSAGVEAPFLDLVPIRFGVVDVAAHYHVPLLISPFGYTTYRGS